MKNINYWILKDSWWIIGFIFVSIFEIFLIWAYPVIIAPLFNKFEPLKDNNLREKIEELIRDVGFHPKGVYQMDSSKRSTHSNAYFTGLGRSKRIILFDTLLKKIQPDEILCILAHEIGHYKKRHIYIQLIISLFLTFISFYILNLLLGWNFFFHSLWIETPSLHTLIVLTGLFCDAFTFYLTPLFNLISRWQEFDADRFAVLKTKSPVTFQNALIKLSKDNLSHPVVHPLYSFYNYTHPPLIERLEAIKTFSCKLFLTQN